MDAEKKCQAFNLFGWLRTSTEINSKKKILIVMIDIYCIKIQ